MTLRKHIVAASLLMAAAGFCGTGCGKGDAPAATTTAVTLPNAPAGAGRTLGKLPPTNDAREVAKRLVSAFKSVDSLQIATSGDQFIQAGRVMGSHQESVITYSRQPARFSRVTVDQVSGTFKSVADGLNLVTYSGLTNTYTRQECRGDISEICKTVHAETPQLLTAASYLMSGDTPRGLQDFMLKGREQVNGKPAYVLQANCAPDLMSGLGRQLKLPAGMSAKSGKVAIWVDAETYFPMRQRIELIWTGMAPGGKRPATFAIAVNEKTTRIATNPTVHDEEFKFAAPANAKEVFATKKETASL